jgi:hypothetical protein
MLPGLAPSIVSPRSPLVGAAVAAGLNSSATTYTFTNLASNIGADDYAVISTYARGGSNRVVVSATIGVGLDPLSIIYQSDTNPGSDQDTHAFLVGPIGVGGTVAITYSGGGQVRSGAICTPVKNIVSWTPFATGAVASGNLLLDVPANGLVLALGVRSSAPAMSGVTQNGTVTAGASFLAGGYYLGGPETGRVLSSGGSIAAISVA